MENHETPTKEAIEKARFLLKYPDLVYDFSYLALPPASLSTEPDDLPQFSTHLWEYNENL